MTTEKNDVGYNMFAATAFKTFMAPPDMSEESDLKDLETFLLELTTKSYGRKDALNSLCLLAGSTGTPQALDKIMAHAGQLDEEIRHIQLMIFDSACQVQNTTNIKHLVNQIKKPLNVKFLVEAGRLGRLKTMQCLEEHYTPRDFSFALARVALTDQTNREAFDFLYDRADPKDLKDLRQEMEEIEENKLFHDNPPLPGILMLRERFKVDDEHSLLTNMTERVLAQRAEQSSQPEDLNQKPRI